MPTTRTAIRSPAICSGSSPASPQPQRAEGSRAPEPARRRRLARANSRLDRVRQRVVDVAAVDARAADDRPSRRALRGCRREGDLHRPFQRLPASAPRSWSRVLRLDHDARQPAAARLGRNEDRSARRVRTARFVPRPRRRAHLLVLHRRVEPRETGRQPDAVQRPADSDPPHQLLRATPAASESRQPCSRGSVADGRPSSVIPLSPSSRPTPPVTRSTGATSTPSFSKSVERRGVLDGNQPPQILTHDVVERNAMRRLIPLAACKGRAIALGEECEAEADDEERRRDDRVAGIARERKGRQPNPERTAAGHALDQPQRRAATAASDEYCRREGDESGQKEDEIPVPSPRHSSRVTSKTAAIAAASTSEKRSATRGESGDHSGQSTPVAAATTRSARTIPWRREDAAGQDLAHRSTRPVGDERAAERRPRRARRRPCESQCGRLRNSQERQLPASCAVPREPAAGGGEIGTKRHCSQKREREQQRGRFAADDAEPSPCGTARDLRLAQLLDRRDQIEVRCQPTGARSVPAPRRTRVRPSPTTGVFRLRAESTHA